MNNYELKNRLLCDISEYLDKHFCPPPTSSGLLKSNIRATALNAAPFSQVTCEPVSNSFVDIEPKKGKERSLEDVIKEREETFSQSLLRIIDQRGLTDAEVYKRAFIDRKLFSKIRSSAEYKPAKSTAISLALSLHLSLDEVLDLIGRAGYTLSASNKADLIIRYFIEHSNYDIILINEALYHFDQPLLST